MTRERKAWQVLDKAESFGLRAGENLVFHNVLRETSKDGICGRGKET